MAVTNPPVLRICLYGATGSDLTAFANRLSGALVAKGFAANVTTLLAPCPPGEPAHDLTLLMGLTALPSVPAPPASQQEAADQAIRSALAHAGVAYQVIYGNEAARLAQAVQAAELRWRPASAGPLIAPQSEQARAWVWNCEKCSDPRCEHLLFTDLMARRDS